MKYKSGIFFVIALLSLAIVLVAGCDTSASENLAASQQTAVDFVKMEATYRFDGMPETFSVTGATSVAGGYEFTCEFDSRAAGFGNRTGQMVAQVITHHSAVVRVENGKVKSAVMDGKWDMMQGRMLSTSATGGS